MKRATVGSDDAAPSSQFEDDQAAAAGSDAPVAYRALDPTEVDARAKQLDAKVFLNSTGNCGFTTAVDGENENTTAVHIGSEAPGHRLSEAELLDISELCDQLEYWAIYESRHPEEKSVLAADERLVATLLGMIAHSRSPVLHCGLRVLAALLGNPVTAGTVARQRTVQLQRREGEANDAWVPTTALALLYDASTRFPNKVEVQTLVISVTRSIAPHVIEDFLTADVVASTLSAMTRFPSSTDLQREAVLLFADTIDVPRADPEDAPIAILYLHVGRIVEFVVKAAALVPTNSEVAHALVRIFLAMARRPENDDELGSTTALPALCQILHHHSRNCTVATDVLTALACMTRWMDAFQHRAILTNVQRTMASVSDFEVLASCCALVHVTFQQYEREIRRALALYKTRINDGPATERAAAFAEAVEAVEGQWERAQKLREHAQELRLPPLISLAMDHYGDESEDLLATGQAAMSSLVMQRFAPRVPRSEEPADVVEQSA